VWEGVFGVANVESWSVAGQINYTTMLANTFQAYSSHRFSARRPGNYYVELCAGAQVNYIITCNNFTKRNESNLVTGRKATLAVANGPLHALAAVEQCTAPTADECRNSSAGTLHPCTE